MFPWYKFYKNKKSESTDNSPSEVSPENFHPVEIRIRPDSTSWFWTDDGIFYNGRRVILYIKKQFQSILEKDDKEYKFHIVGCSTLKNIENPRRYKKYFATEKTDGIFEVKQIIDNKTEKKEITLHVCKNCLNTLNWKGYKKASPEHQNEIYENFSIEEFFQYMKTGDYENDTLTNVYLENWKIISDVIQTKRGYICDECKEKILRLSDLHIHNINGRKFDCSRANLEVLCTDCHQKRHNQKIVGGRNF